jgi:hypothetical protein
MPLIESSSLNDSRIVNDVTALVLPVMKSLRDPSCMINDAKLIKNMGLKLSLVLSTMENYFHSAGRCGTQFGRNGLESWYEILLVVTRWYLHIIFKCSSLCSVSDKPYGPVHVCLSVCLLRFSYQLGNSHDTGSLVEYIVTTVGARIIVGNIAATVWTEYIVGTHWCNSGNPGILLSHNNDPGSYYCNKDLGYHCWVW